MYTTSYDNLNDKYRIKLKVKLNYDVGNFYRGFLRVILIGNKL